MYSKRFPGFCSIFHVTGEGRGKWQRRGGEFVPRGEKAVSPVIMKYFYIFWIRVPVSVVIFRGFLNCLIGGGFVFVFFNLFWFFFLLVRFSWPRKTLVGISFLPTEVSN